MVESNLKGETQVAMAFTRRLSLLVAMLPIREIRKLCGASVHKNPRGAIRYVPGMHEVFLSLHFLVVAFMQFS